MELRHLRYFKAVAEQLNFSRAAEQLHVAQPALSRQIRALEDELGARLLERNHVRVHLTDAGRTLHARACKILAEADMAAAAVHEVAHGAAGELVICNDWHLGHEFVPATVAEFRTRHPRVEVTLLDRKLHDQLELVRTRRVHLGFIVRDMLGARRDLELLPVLVSRLFVALPASHPRARQKNVRLCDLAREPWIVIDEKESPGHAIFLAQLCRLSGFNPVLGQAATTLEGIYGRVASGYGIALALEHMLPTRQQLLRFLPTDAAPLELCAVWHRQEQSVLLRQYLRILRQHAGARLDDITPINMKGPPLRAAPA